jgi:antitoxin component YwqK of YwqJK toxin-antitoxin module
MKEMKLRYVFRLCLAVTAVSLVATTSYGADDVPPPPAAFSVSNTSEAKLTVEIGPVTAETPETNEDETEIIRERRADGSIKIVRHMIQDAEGNYIKHGLWQELDEAGEVIAEGKYVNNNRHGTWRRTVDGANSNLFSDEPYKSFQGPFASEATLNHGKLHGSWTIYDNAGEKISVLEFADGERHGTAVWLYPNGKTMQSSTFVDGVIDGELNRFDVDGNVTATELYDAGRKVESQVDFYENKQQRSETKFLHPQLIIGKTDDWWNVSLASFTSQGQPMQHGTWTIWHENGQKKELGTFDHGRRVGEFISWHSNGQKASEGIYDEGKQDGRWVWWYANGQKQTDGHYTNGRRSGDWAWWNEEGRIEERTSLLTPKQPAERTSRRTTEGR